MLCNGWQWKVFDEGLNENKWWKIAWIWWKQIIIGEK